MSLILICDRFNLILDAISELLEIRERYHAFTRNNPLVTPHELYLGACRKYGVEPCSQLVAAGGLEGPVLDVSNRSLGSSAAMALAVVLLVSGHVHWW